jgi:outer membrane protein assembly factor BamB
MRPSRGRLALPFILLIVSPSFLGSLSAQDWPHWRGPGSTGVGVMAPAPERWSPTEGVSWRAEIEGSGASSPVIAGDRVYVTTAITLKRRSAIRLACDCLIALLAVIGVPALVRRRWTLSMASPSTNHRGLPYRAVEAFDLVLLVLLALAVLVFATLMAIGPTAMDFGIKAAREVAVALARSLGRERTNFSFLAWDEGTRHHIWIVSSGIALATLALVPFAFPKSRVVRVGAAVTLFIAIGLLKAYVPWPPAYAGLYPTGALIVLYSPVAALALWHLLASLMRGAQTAEESGALGSRLVGCVPILIALAMFVSPNFISEREVVTRRLVSLNSATGARVWHTDLFSTTPEAKASQNSYATPTPSLVQDGIVVAFGLGIAAVGLDGHVRWSKTFPHWIENSVYGAASSPVADGEVIYITSDREFDASEPSRVIAYSMKTGDELWSRAPQFARDGYTTPIIHDDGGRKLLLTLTSNTLVAYDATSGGVTWKVTTPVGQPVPSLIADAGRLYVTGAGGYTAAYQLQRNTAPDELWVSRRNPADVSSPVLYQGRLYTISSTGIMVSYDAHSGKIIWRQRLDSARGAFYASLAAADDKVYVARSDGTTFVIAVEDTFRLVSESSLSEEIIASPAFGADCLFLRTASAVYCIRND